VVPGPPVVPSLPQGMLVNTLITKKLKTNS
jgi:hypothetical protein